MSRRDTFSPRVEQRDGILTIYPRGSLGSLDWTAHELSDWFSVAIGAPQPMEVRLDLGQLKYGGAALVSAILLLRQEIGGRGGHLSVGNVPGPLSKVLRVTACNVCWACDR